MARATEFLKLGFPQLDACGFEFIDELEQLFLPTHELGARLSATSIEIGHAAQAVKVLGRRRDVAWSALSAMGQDGAGVRFASVAMAGRLAALSPQGVERARQEGIATEAVFQEGRQEMLSLAELGAERAESLFHAVHGAGGGVL